MDEQQDRGAAGDAELLKRIKSLEKEIRVLKRSADRPKGGAFGAPFGMPPPPMPNTMQAAGPMMLAWLMSWMFPSQQPNAGMLDSMARFAAARGEFWHHSFEAFAAMAHQAAQTSQSNGRSQLSPDDKIRIKSALEGSKLPPHVVDSVLHAMNALDAFQSYREAAMPERHN